LADSVQFGTSDYFDVALSNYVGCSGWGTPYPIQAIDSEGMLFGNSWLNMSSCTDGTSNTMLVAERDYKINHAATWVGVGRNNDYGNYATLRTIFRAAFTMNFDYKAAGAPENAGKGWSSLHPGGCNVLLTDASVRFMPETINAASVVHWLCKRNDGNVFQLP
jgi:hypothetical protein